MKNFYNNEFQLSPEWKTVGKKLAIYFLFQLLLPASLCFSTVPITYDTTVTASIEVKGETDAYKPVFSGNGTDHMNIHLVNLQISGFQAGDA